MVNHSAEAMAEYARLFVVEAIRRAGLVAQRDGSDSIERQHVEKIMAQLVLDFQ